MAARPSLDGSDDPEKLSTVAVVSEPGRKSVAVLPGFTAIAE
jgi:hypothetical protein